MAALDALAFVLAVGSPARWFPSLGDARGARGRAVARRRSARTTTIGPELVGGALLAGAALMALRVRARPRFAHARSARRC